MRLASLALAALMLATSAASAAPLRTVPNPFGDGVVTVGAPANPAPGVTAHPDWSAGYEAAYLDLCNVTPAERALWASPIVAKGPRIDRAEYASGFMAAIEDAASYDEQGFDSLEWCGDNHP